MGTLSFLRIGNRSFWGSGRPRGPNRPFQKVGGFAPHFLQGLPKPGYLKAVWPDFWVRFWGLGRGGPGRPCKMWGASPPTFLDGFQATRGRPDPKNRPKKVRPDCLQVPSKRSNTDRFLTYLGAPGPPPRARGRVDRADVAPRPGVWATAAPQHHKTFQNLQKLAVKPLGKMII